MTKFPSYAVSPETVYDEHNALVQQLNKNWIVATSAHIGNSSDYVGIDKDGISLNGDATVFEDETGSVLGQNISAPASKIAYTTFNNLQFSTNCPLSDYLAINFQTKHAMKTRASVYPHVHWIQESSKMPNWLIRYRWQYNGKVTASAWTAAKWSSNAFVYSTGQLNQITGFPAIAQTSDAYISDILEMKFTRDSANASSQFTSTDAYGVPAYVRYVDLHWERDTLGSKTEYIK